MMEISTELMISVLVVYFYIGNVLSAKNATYPNYQLCFNSQYSSSSVEFQQVYPEIEQEDPNITPLYFGLLATYSENIQTCGLIPAVQLALDAINTDPNILNGFRLHYTLTLTECSGVGWMDSTITQLFREPGAGRKLGLIEATCVTNAKQEFAHTYFAHHYNVPQILCSPAVRDQSDHVNVFEMFPYTYVDNALAIVGMIKKYNWTKLALLVEDEEKYIRALRSLKNMITSEDNITLSVTTLSIVNGTLSVHVGCANQIFVEDVRIFVLAVSSSMARHLICKASHLSMKYPKYTFITLEFSQRVNPFESEGHYQCTPEQRAEVLNYSLALESGQSLGDEPQPEANSGQLGSGFWSDYSSRLGCPPSEYKYALLDYCSDATWILALALNKTVSGLRRNETLLHEYEGTSIEKFVYSNEVLADVYRNILETSFLGRSGNVKFAGNGVRKTTVRVQQHRTKCPSDEAEIHTTIEKQCISTPITIGSVEHEKFSLVEGQHDGIIWPKGIPYDGSTVSAVVTVSVPLAVIFNLLATMGVIFNFICFLFNFLFRKTKIVRLTSPNLNYLMIVGTLLVYLTVYWYFVPSTNPRMVVTACCFQIGFLAIGYSLVLGTMVAKVWRIYYIFRNPNSIKKYAVSDYHLMIFVFSLMATTMLILIFYVAFEGGISNFETMLIANKDQLFEISGERGINTSFYFYTCSRAPLTRQITAGIFYTLMFILQSCALFFAFKTRKVRIKGLNDAKHITAIVYVSSVTALVNLLISYTLRDHVNAFPAALNGSTILTSTIILCLVFIPKMVSLYKDPKGEHIFSAEEVELAQCSTKFAVNNVDTGHCNSCEQLKNRVKELEEEKALLLTDPPIHQTCPILPQNPSPTCSNNCDNLCSHLNKASDENLCFDDYLESFEVSWAEDGSYYHIGHRV